MVHVMSSQLLWPTTAKTESPRKEPTTSLRILFNDVTTQRAPPSNNDPWSISEISKDESLLIDLKISSRMCWPFRAGVHMDPTPSLEWSELCLDSLTRLAIQWRGCKHKTRPLRGLYSLPTYSWLCFHAKQFERIIFQPCWRVIKTEIGCFTNKVAREVVSNVFGVLSSFYGVFWENVLSSK